MDRRGGKWGMLPGARLAQVLSATALAALAGLMAFGAAAADAQYGAFGPEGPRLREQLWVVPGGDAATPLRATLFRPASDGRRQPLVVINHGSDAATREAVAMPVFYWLSRWFVARGYAVLVPQRRGHGATGGEFVEGRDSCTRTEHFEAAQAAADDIEAAVRFMQRQDFVDASRVVVAGTSTGGWASLAVAGRPIPGLRLVVNFAGGRGGHAFGRPNVVCARDKLIEAAGRLALGARVPSVWFYARNDSYFGPELASAMAAAWERNGGLADLRLLPSYGADGHDLVADRASWPLWEGALSHHLEDAEIPGSSEPQPAEVVAATTPPPSSQGR
ncbi:MAG: dienelactone hydrolase family protein [Hyphomicrobiaceae bacterium]